MKQNREILYRGRKVITLSNQSYLDENKTEQLTTLPCSRCNMIIEREEGKHFGQCTGCGAYDFRFYRPTPTQQAIITDNSEIVVSYGAMNNGKTDAFVYKIVLLHCLRYSNATVGIVCHSLESIQQTVIPTYKQFIPEGLVKRKNGRLLWNMKQIVFKNGSKIVFFPADKPGKIRSLNASMMAGHEATEIKWEVISQMSGRLRKRVLEKSTDIDIYGIINPNEKGDSLNVGQMLLDGNPKVGSWINEKYLPYVGKIYITKDSHIEDYTLMLSDVKEMKETISLHNYPAISNPYVMADGGKFLSIQKTAYHGVDDIQYQQNVLGKIVTGTGLVYPNFRKALITPFSLDYSKMNIYFGSDLGFSNACSTIVIAEHRETGMLYVCDGYKERGLDVRQNAEMIKNLISRYSIGKIIYMMCDSQGTRKTHDSVAGSIFQQYASLGVHFSPASKNRENTIAHLNTLINTGRLKIFNSLHFLLSEFPKFVYKQKETTGERTISRRDCDTLDALRYGVENIAVSNTIAENVEKTKKEINNLHNPFLRKDWNNYV